MYIATKGADSAHITNKSDKTAGVLSITTPAASEAFAAGGGLSLLAIITVTAVIFLAVLLLISSLLLPHPWMTYDDGSGYLKEEKYTETYDEINDITLSIIRESANEAKNKLSREAEKRLQKIRQQYEDELNPEDNEYINVDLSGIRFIPLYFDEGKMAADLTPYYLATNQVIFAGEQLEEVLKPGESIEQSFKSILKFNGNDYISSTEKSVIGSQYRIDLKTLLGNSIFYSKAGEMALLNVKTDGPVIDTSRGEDGKVYEDVPDPLINGKDPGTTHREYMKNPDGSQKYYQKYIITGDLYGSLWYSFGSYKRENAQSEYLNAFNSYQKLYDTDHQEELKAAITSYFFDLIYIMTDIRYEEMEDYPTAGGINIACIDSLDPDIVNDLLAGILEDPFSNDDYEEIIWDLNNEDLTPGVIGDLFALGSGTGYYPELWNEYQQLVASGILDPGCYTTNGGSTVGAWCTGWMNYFLYKASGQSYFSLGDGWNRADTITRYSGWERTANPSAGSVFSVIGGYADPTYGHVGIVSRVEGNFIWICDGNINSNGFNVRLNQKFTLEQFRSQYSGVKFASYVGSN